MAKKMAATPMMSKGMGSKGMAKTSMPSSAAPKTVRPVPLPMANTNPMANNPAMPPMAPVRSAPTPKVMPAKGMKGKKGM